MTLRIAVSGSAFRFLPRLRACHSVASSVAEFDFEMSGCEPMFGPGRIRCWHLFLDADIGILHLIDFSFRQIQTKYRTLTSLEPFWSPVS